MKKLKTIIIAVSTAMFAANVAAQDMPESGIELNGLVIGHEYSMQQYYKALGGMPSSVKGENTSDVYPNSITLYYKKNYFTIVDNMFHGFDVTSSRYIVNGKVRVGYGISTVLSLDGVTAESGFDEAIGYGVLNWHPTDAPVGVYIYYDRNDKIIKILAMTFDL